MLIAPVTCKLIQSKFYDTQLCLMPLNDSEAEPMASATVQCSVRRSILKASFSCANYCDRYAPDELFPILDILISL